MTTAVIQKIITQVLDGSRLDTKRKPIRGVRFPTTLAVHYMRWIRAYVRDLKRVTDDWVETQLKSALAMLEYEQDGIRQDSVEEIERKLDNLWANFSTVMSDEAIKQYVYEHSREILAYSKRQWIRSIHAISGVDPLLHDAPMERIVKAHVRENVSLIKSIPQKYHNDVDRVVMSGVRSGKLLKDIEKDIVDVYPGSYDRAALIARDQAGSLNAAIVDEQYKQANLATYVWRTMQDQRVRGNPWGKYPKARYSHYEREGKVFSADDPPPDGHPGEAINCRCFRQPQDAEVLGEEGGILKPGQNYDVPEVRPAAVEVPSRLPTIEQWAKSITNNEKLALYNWQGGFYPDIRAFRMGQYRAGESVLKPPLEQLKKWTKDIENAIKRAPQHEGITYRGMAIEDKDVLQELFSQKEITFKAFSSSSTAESVARDFALHGEGSPVLLEIHGKTGARLFDVPGLLVEEREVLFGPGTRLKVKTVEEITVNQEQGIKMILEEI